MKRNFIISTMLFYIVYCYAYDFEINGIYYNYNSIEQNAYVVSGDIQYSGAIIIPGTVSYNGKTLDVVAIGNSTFNDCKKLTSVTLPEGLFSIGRYAFCGCEGIKTLKFPNSLTYIGEHAFDGCINLISVSLPNGLRTIENSAFYECIGFTKITIPNSITSIGKSAFSGCSNIKTLVLEDGKEIMEIGKYAFNNVAPENLYDGRGILTAVDNQDNLRFLSIGKYVNYLFLKAENLKCIYSFSEYPENFSTYMVINSKTFVNTKLYVPIGTKEKYAKTKEWENFFQIEEMDINKMWNGVGEPQDSDNPNIKKCLKPTINYNKGKLTFETDTEGAVCLLTITDDDIKTFRSNEVLLSVTYNISVYATKAGYEDSETAKATLCWIDVDPKTEGISNGVANVRATAVMIQSQNGMLTIQGVDEGSDIAVYTVSGHMVGSTKAIGNQASLATNIKKGEVAIIKIGEKSVKVVMQ